MTPTDIDLLMAQLLSGQTTATHRILDRACTSTDPTLLVAAALLNTRPAQLSGPDLLARAKVWAKSTRDRQLVAIATAHLAGNSDRVDALAREHLVDYPDNVLVSWLAFAARPSKPDHTTTARTHPN